MLDTKEIKKQIYIFLAISIFFLIFGFIYETYSHGVYSYYMMCAFTIPLILGFLIYLIIYRKKLNKYFSELGMRIFNCSIITLTIGSVMQGFLEIYGTTNKLVFVYLQVGAFLMIMSVIINIIHNMKRKMR